MVTLGLPSDYFPTSIGTTWEYEITVTDVDALNYKEVTWPMGNGMEQVTAVRGYFMGKFREDDSTKTKFRLRYRIIGNAKQQGIFQYEDARKLEVLEDEFGIFDDVEELFWLISPGMEYQITEVRTYNPNTPGAPRSAWGGWNQESGCAYHLIFFGSPPGISISLNKSPESLAFWGVQDGMLYFRRTIEGDGESKLNQTFIEDMWFAKGKGLVKLVQKIDGRISMTWQLKRVS